MTPENFIYWLNGFFELSGETTLNPAQVMIIKEHLALVMKKETPNLLVDGFIQPGIKRIISC